MLLSNKNYDIINKIERWLYALGTAYLALAGVWGLPYGDEINKTIVIVGTLLASFLEISTSVYHKSQNESVDISYILEGEDEEEGEGGVG